MPQSSKVRTLADAIRLIADGHVVAIGGAEDRHNPMAAVREIIRQKRHALRVVGCSKSLAIELLSAAGCTGSIDTNAAAGLQAAALGLPFLPLREDMNAVLGDVTLADPFTGKMVGAVQAVMPDIAILHGYRADAAGNVQLAPDGSAPLGDDAMLAGAARAVIITVEQIVSQETISRRAQGSVLPNRNIACIVEAPYGAFPTGFGGGYRSDAAQTARCRTTSASNEKSAAFLFEEMANTADHWAYLDRIGARAFMTISTNRAIRE